MSTVAESGLPGYETSGWVEFARLLFDAVGSRNKTIRVFTTDEGGSEHVQGDNRSHAANYVADRAADNF